MAKFQLSAFTDEYSPNFDKQIEGMLKTGVKLTELRGVNGKNVSQLTVAEAKEVKAKLDANGLGVWSVGSPLGKINLTDDIDKHIELTKHVCELANVLGTPRIRVFSFFVPNTSDIAPYRNQVMDYMGRMLDASNAAGTILCHENEKDIYGAKTEGCVDIMKYFNGGYKCIFDPANFIQEDVTTYPDAFEALKDDIYYMHIKDALADKSIVPAGAGLGKIPEILAELNKRDETITLTVEPHLRVFAGLAALEKDGSESVVKNAYPTSEDAFIAAVDAIKALI